MAHEDTQPAAAAGAGGSSDRHADDYGLIGSPSTLVVLSDPPTRSASTTGDLASSLDLLTEIL